MQLSGIIENVQDVCAEKIATIFTGKFCKDCKYQRQSDIKNRLKLHQSAEQNDNTIK